jgi:hypothetical protein
MNVSGQAKHDFDLSIMPKWRFFALRQRKPEP